MRKLYEIFQVLKIQKIIVSAETICGNTLSEFVEFAMKHPVKHSSVYQSFNKKRTNQKIIQRK